MTWLPRWPRGPADRSLLPYTPVHRLVFRESGLAALVMTSANPHDEPICRDEDEALERLRGIADGFLGHDRPIVTRCDDSVAFVAEGQVRVTRRSRGLVPLPLRLPVSGDPVLAVGGDLKNAFVVTRGDLPSSGPTSGTWNGRPPPHGCWRRPNTSAACWRSGPGRSPTTCTRTTTRQDWPGSSGTA
jgi:hypothetical protein